MGSSTGDVLVQAQGNVAIAGSDLVSGQNTVVIGRNVTLNPGTDRHDSHDSRETHDVRQSGLTITASGPIAANAANNDPNAAPASKPLAVKFSATVGSSRSHAESVRRETVQSGSKRTLG